MTDPISPDNIDPQDLDPRQAPEAEAPDSQVPGPDAPTTPEASIADVTAEDITTDATTPESPAASTPDPGAAAFGGSPSSEDDADSDDLGAGAFDTPPAEEAPDAESVSDAEEAPGDDRDPKKAYLGRPELTPLYAMAGLADLAAAVVRDIANEQIAAYRARRAKDEEAVEDLTEKIGETAKDSNAQFNEFLSKAQLRTQELFEQAVAQYEHLADRGRVAVGDVLEAAKQQQKAREEAEKAEPGSTAAGTTGAGTTDAGTTDDTDETTPTSDDAPQA